MANIYEYWTMGGKTVESETEGNSRYRKQREENMSEPKRSCIPKDRRWSKRAIKYQIKVIPGDLLNIWHGQKLDYVSSNLFELSTIYTLPKVVYWCYCEFIRLYQQKDQRTLKKSKKRHQKSTSRQHESKSGRGHNSIYYNRLNTGSQYGKFFDAWTILQALTIT